MVILFEALVEIENGSRRPETKDERRKTKDERQGTVYSIRLAVRSVAVSFTESVRCSDIHSTGT